MSPEQYRHNKDMLIQRQREALVRAQQAAVEVDDARSNGNWEALQMARDKLERCTTELEDLIHQLGDY